MQLTEPVRKALSFLLVHPEYRAAVGVKIKAPEGEYFIAPPTAGFLQAQGWGTKGKTEIEAMTYVALTRLGIEVAKAAAISPHIADSVYDTCKTAAGIAPTVAKTIAEEIRSIDVATGQPSEPHPVLEPAKIQAALDEMSGAEAKPAKKAKAAVKHARGQGCFCGCGLSTLGYFVPGHDAKAKGLLMKLSKGKLAGDALLDACIDNAMGPRKVGANR